MSPKGYFLIVDYKKQIIYQYDYQYNEIRKNIYSQLQQIESQVNNALFSCFRSSLDRNKIHIYYIDEKFILLSLLSLYEGNVGTEKYIEIYDFCSPVKGKGYGKDLMKFIFHIYQDYNIYLGVMVKQNPDNFKVLISMYVKFGFYYPLYTNKLISKERHKFDFILLKRDKYYNPNQAESRIKTIETIKDGMENFYTRCDFILDNDVINYIIKNYCLTKNFEIAGKFYIMKTNVRNVYNLKLDTNSKVEGKENTCEIDKAFNFEKDKIAFHTHPKFCYRKYDTNLGWPSARDSILQLDKSIEKKSFFQIVFSSEGVYILSINPVFLIYYESIKQQELYKQIRIFLENFLMLVALCKNIDTPEKGNEIFLWLYKDSSIKNFIVQYKSIKSLLSVEHNRKIMEESARLLEYNIPLIINNIENSITKMKDEDILYHLIFDLLFYDIKESKGQNITYTTYIKNDNI